VFTTPWCGPCARLKSRLSERNISFVEVDVEQDAEAAAWVIQANHGNRTVPTVRLPDGTTLTNPTPDDVETALRDSGM
jgi:mycoredoxin